jgi:hypothetical protein
MRNRLLGETSSIEPTLQARLFDVRLPAPTSQGENVKVESLIRIKDLSWSHLPHRARIFEVRLPAQTAPKKGEDISGAYRQKGLEDWNRLEPITGSKRQLRRLPAETAER